MRNFLFILVACWAIFSFTSVDLPAKRVKQQISIFKPKSPSVRKYYVNVIEKCTPQFVGDWHGYKDDREYDIKIIAANKYRIKGEFLNQPDKWSHELIADVYYYTDENDCFAKGVIKRTDGKGCMSVMNITLDMNKDKKTFFQYTKNTDGKCEGLTAGFDETILFVKK